MILTDIRFTQTTNDLKSTFFFYQTNSLCFALHAIDFMEISITFKIAYEGENVGKKELAKDPYYLLRENEHLVTCCDCDTTDAKTFSNFCPKCYL